MFSEQAKRSLPVRGGVFAASAKGAGGGAEGVFDMWCAADGGGVLKDLETAFSLMAWPTNYMETLLEFEKRVLRPFGAAPHTALVYIYDIQTYVCVCV